MNKLVEGVLNGNRRSLARLLTVIENQQPDAGQAMQQIFPHTGRAWVIGITGAPGTGKSSLVNALAKAYRSSGQTVGIIAVDPTSPFSGGAILGDRIRMSDLSGDSGVFIRSMATRGSLGGLARATRDAVRVLDAGGYDLILVETVGAGQSEVDIVRTAHTTVVVEAPGLGDDVQAIKAGILEIADILVVNKADRVGADQTVRSLRAMLELGHPAARERFTSHHGQLMEIDDAYPEEGSFDTWMPPVVKTIATTQEGISDLVAAMNQHRHYMQTSSHAPQIEARYIEIELVERLQDALLKHLLSRIAHADLPALIEQIRTRQLDPQTAVQDLLSKMNDAKSTGLGEM
jgi:LAO/AO transport system kinase